MTHDKTSTPQFGRALYELYIDIICSNTPQAKGRVESGNQTLQDRLVKELRLRGIDTIAAANAYASEFMADFNRRFGKEPRNPKDMHRSFAAHENLDRDMCRKEVRKLSQALTLRYDKVLFIHDPTDLAKRLAGNKVVVCDYPDGRLEITHEGTSLPYRTFDTLRSVHRSRWLRTSGLMTCWPWWPRCRPDVSNSAARVDRAAPVRPTICSAFATAVQPMATKSAAPSLAGGRILPMQASVGFL
jgi:hypothetical protein